MAHWPCNKTQSVTENCKKRPSGDAFINTRYFYKVVLIREKQEGTSKYQRRLLSLR